MLRHNAFPISSARCGMCELMRCGVLCRSTIYVVCFSISRFQTNLTERGCHEEVYRTSKQSFVATWFWSGGAGPDGTRFAPSRAFDRSPGIRAKCCQPTTPPPRQVLTPMTGCIQITPSAAFTAPGRRSPKWIASRLFQETACCSNGETPGEIANCCRRAAVLAGRHHVRSIRNGCQAPAAWLCRAGQYHRLDEHRR